MADTLKSGSGKSGSGRAGRTRTSGAIALRFVIAAALVTLLAAVPAGATPQNFAGVAGLNTNAPIDTGLDDAPQVVHVAGDTWMAVWTSNDSLDGTVGGDFDILYARSTDGGATWNAPAPLNTNAATDAGIDNEVAIAHSAFGTTIAVWASTDTLGDTLGFDRDILFARSTDDGLSWSATAALKATAPTDVGNDFDPVIVAGGENAWVALWSSTDSLGNTIGGDHDILVSRSTDDGVTWSAPTALHSNATTDFGTDRWPEIASDGAGNMVAVWASTDPINLTTGLDADIITCRSSDDGATWTPPVHLNDYAQTDSRDDELPHITTDRAGNWYAVWGTQHEFGAGLGEDFDIAFARSANAGQTWSAATIVNSNAAVDERHDAAPSIVANTRGELLAVWQLVVGDGTTTPLREQIWIARSGNNGGIWEPEKRLSHRGASAANGRNLAARLATDDEGRTIAVWVSTDTLDGTVGSDGDVLFRRREVAAPEATVWALTGQ